MFDVIWTDHARQSVGERKARQGSRKSEEPGESEENHDHPLARRVSASHSSSSSNIGSPSSSSTRDLPLGPKPPGILGSLRLKKSMLFSRNRTAASAQSSISGLSEATSDVSLSSFPIPPASLCPITPDETSSIIRQRESAPSQTVAGASISSLISQVTEALGPDSWATMDGQTAFEPLSEPRMEHSQDGVTVLIERLTDRLDMDWPTPPASPERSAIATSRLNKRHPRAGHFGSPALWGHESKAIQAAVQLPDPLVTPSNSAQHGVGIVPCPFRPAMLAAHGPSAWRPPSQWDRPSRCATPTAVRDRGGRGPTPTRIQPSPDLASMQREVAKMASASPQVKLLRLGHDYSRVRDPALRADLDAEQKLWMLSALFSLDQSDSHGSGQQRPQPSDAPSREILAFFESEAAASYLAATHPDSTITHLSPAPLPTSRFPNIRPHPAAVPADAAAAGTPALLPDPAAYGAIHALSLPAQLAGPAMAAALRRLAGLLAPGGALRLVLVDPAPAAAGPRLRGWLDQRLVLGLQRRFRCVRPARLVPGWLADAGLRPRRARFRARLVPPPGAGADARLRCAVARSLWREVWGGHVGDRAAGWWWEDADVVEECLRLETDWEYSIVEAVKGG